MRHTPRLPFIAAVFICASLGVAPTHADEVGFEVLGDNIDIATATNPSRPTSGEVSDVGYRSVSGTVFQDAAGDSFVLFKLGPAYYAHYAANTATPEKQNRLRLVKPLDAGGPGLASTALGVGAEAGRNPVLDAVAALPDGIDGINDETLPINYAWLGGRIENGENDYRLLRRAEGNGTFTYFRVYAADAADNPNTQQALSGGAVALATALGADARASREQSTAVGAQARAISVDSTALGANAQAGAENATAIGESARATQTDTTALGAGAQASAENATAIGESARATQTNTTALGADAQATEGHATAIGKSAEAVSSGTTAVGVAAQATSMGATVLGAQAEATGAHALGLGSLSEASGDHAIAAGTNSEASGDYSIAAGWGSDATKEGAIAIGRLAQATGEASTAVGREANATKDFTIALGRGAEATHDRATAIGINARTSRDNQIVLGTRFTGLDFDGDGVGDDGSFTTTYTLPGLPGAASAATQSGATHLVTSDASGNLAATLSLDAALAELGFSEGALSVLGDNIGVANAVSSLTPTETEVSSAGYEAIATALQDAEGDSFTLYRASRGYYAHYAANTTTPEKQSRLRLIKLLEGDGPGLASLALGRGAEAGHNASLGIVEALPDGIDGIADETLPDNYVWLGARIENGDNDYRLLRRKNNSGTWTYFRVYASDAADNPNMRQFVTGDVAVLATALGFEARASGNQSTAVGAEARASDTDATALGANARATGENATAIGESAHASDTDATALGANARATGENATAIGESAQATGAGGTAVGEQAQATGTGASALGARAEATNIYAIALGAFSEATAQHAIAAGWASEATKDYAIAIGHGAEGTGVASIALGRSTEASGEYSIAVGRLAQATHDRAIAIGAGARTSRANQIVLGTRLTGTDADGDGVGDNNSSFTTTYTLPGLPSAVSQNAQSGALRLVTSDTSGTLAATMSFDTAFAASVVGGIEVETNNLSVGSDNTPGENQLTAAGYTRIERGLKDVEGDSFALYRLGGAYFAYYDSGTATTEKQNRLRAVVPQNNNGAQGAGSLALGLDARAGRNLRLLDAAAITGIADTDADLSSDTAYVWITDIIDTDDDNDYRVLQHTNGNGVVSYFYVYTPDATDTSLRNKGRRVWHEAAGLATAMGIEAEALGERSTAIGAIATAGGAHASAFGTGADANGRLSTAIGTNSGAVATEATALGTEAVAFHDRATALGARAETSRDNQIVLGTSSETYTLPGLSSVASTNAQSGDALFVVTSDMSGNLAARTLDLGTGALSVLGHDIEIANAATPATPTATEVSAGVYDAIATGLEDTGGDSFTLYRAGQAYYAHYAADTATAAKQNRLRLVKPLEGEGPGLASLALGMGAVAGSNPALAAAEALPGDIDNISDGTLPADYVWLGGRIENGENDYRLLRQTESNGEFTYFRVYAEDAAENPDMRRALTGEVPVFATALGAYARATDDYATALGALAQASGDSALALGALAQASGYQSTALGRNARATGVAAIAIGKNTSASAAAAMALGPDAQATMRGAIALGGAAHAFGMDATALGRNTSATMTQATAVGYVATATGEDSLALGAHASAGHTASTAIGAGATTSRANQIIFGTGAEVYTLPGLAAEAGATGFVTVNDAGELITTAIGINAGTGDFGVDFSAAFPVAFTPAFEAAFPVAFAPAFTAAFTPAVETALSEAHLVGSGAARAEANQMIFGRATTERYTFAGLAADDAQSGGMFFVMAEADGTLSRLSFEEAFEGEALAGASFTEAFTPAFAAAFQPAFEAAWGGVRAFGVGARARHEASLAIGDGVVTSRARQIAVGDTSTTYTFAGLSGEGGVVRVVTADEGGNLGTVVLPSGGGGLSIEEFGVMLDEELGARMGPQVGAQVSAQLDAQFGERFAEAFTPRREELEEGIALAAALAGLRHMEGSRLSLAAGVGRYEGETGFAMQMAFRPGRRFLVSAGVGLGERRRIGNVSVSWGF